LQSNPVIKKLLLSGCLFDYASTQEFVRFFQDKKYKATPLVQELYIRPGYSMFGRNASSNRTPSVAEVTATMLVDSSLEVLDLDDELQQGANAEHFFDALISNSSQVSLVALHLDNLSTPSAEALSRFLRTTTTLQRLIVGNIAYNADREVVLSAIRQNGSLHSVNLQRGAASFFATEQMTRMEAFLERNKSVPLLLAKPSLNRFDGGDDDELDSVEKTDLLQFPALMTSSRSAPRMAPNSVLIGLLAVDAESVEANGLSDASANTEEDRIRHHKKPRLSCDSD
jgi:hypothetical protein